MKYLRIGMLCWLVCMLVINDAWAAPRPEIEKVEIKCLQGERLVNSSLENRVLASIQAVSDKLLLGRKVEDVEENKQRFEATIRQVFDRVLYGYELSGVSIRPGQTTVIDFSMTPWGETVQSIEVHIDTGAFSSEDQTLMKQDLAGVEQRIAQVLVGLPVDAFAWADSVSRNMIREIIADGLPEFRADIVFTPSKHTIVNVRLEPSGPIIKKTSVTMRSESVPKLLLLPASASAERAAEQLEGLPIAFVQRHKQVFADRLQQSVDANKTLDILKLSVQGDYILGENTIGEVQAETLQYRIKLEGVIDIGRKGDNNTFLRSHIGFMVKSKTELFLDTQFYPNVISWHFQPGIGQQLTRKTYLGFKRDLADGENSLLAKYKLAEDLSLNVEKNLASGEILTGFEYRLHAFLSAEAVSDGDRTWIRLIGDF